MRAIVLGGVIVIGLVAPLFGMVFEKPTKGQNIVIGKPFDVWIRPEPGEVCERIDTADMPVIPLNPVTGRFEGQVTFDRDSPLGKTNFFAPGEPARKCRDAEIIINVVLPTDVKIEGLGMGGDETFYLNLESEVGKTERLRLWGIYSDDVDREITLPVDDITFESKDEKIVTVDKAGRATAVSLGETFVIAKKGDLTVQRKIKVLK